MNYPQISGLSGRQFDTHAAALIALIIDSQERFLMLSSPKRSGRWECVNGAYDAEESVMDGFLREIREEAGDNVRVRPITAIHTYNFHYDDTIPLMISIVFLFEYLGGDIIPGDDMAGSDVKWMTLDDIYNSDYEIIVPAGALWVYQRGVQFYQLLKDDTHNL